MLREVEREHPRGVVRLLAWSDGEPVFDVSDARLGAAERFALLVSEGRPGELLQAMPRPGGDEDEAEDESPAAEEAPLDGEGSGRA
jgi:hypothetical protein